MDAVPSGEALLEVFKLGGRLGYALSRGFWHPVSPLTPTLTGIIIPVLAPTHPGSSAAKSPHHSQIRWQKAQLRLVVSACFCFPEALLGSSCTTKHTQMRLWPRKWLIPWPLMHSPASSSGSAELTHHLRVAAFWFLAQWGLGYNSLGLRKRTRNTGSTSFLLQPDFKI